MLMRLVSIRSASANAKRTSASFPVAAAGSGRPQCAVIGCPRPDRANLCCSIVADREDEIELRGTRLGELQPALRAHAAYVVIHLSQQIERIWMHLAFRMASSRNARKFPCPARLRISSAIIDRAEFPVHRNSTLSGSLWLVWVIVSSSASCFLRLKHNNSRHE